MSYTKLDYWTEGVACALEEAGVTATAEQIKEVAGILEGYNDNIGTAFPNPGGYGCDYVKRPSIEELQSKIKRLEEELKSQEKVSDAWKESFARIRRVRKDEIFMGNLGPEYIR